MSAAEHAQGEGTGSAPPLHTPTRARDPLTFEFVSKLTPEVIQSMYDALLIGMPVDAAAAYVGIHRRTYYNWLKEGRRALDAAADPSEVVKTNRHACFAAVVELAQANFVHSNLTAIGLHGRQDRPGDVKALQWLLEVRFPAWFSKRTKHEVSGTVQHEHAIAVDPAKLESLTLDEKLQLAELLGKLDGDIIDHEGPVAELGA